MPADEVAVDQGQQETTDQVQDIEDGVYVPDEIAEQDEPVTDEPGEETPSDAQPESGEEPESEPEPEPDEQTEEPEPEKQVSAKVQELERKVFELNRALHHERKKAKEKPPEPEAELTDEQIDGLLEQHKDDPVMLRKIMQYVGQQTAKKATQETVDTQQVAQAKKIADSWLEQRFPELQDDTSPARSYVDTAIKNLRLENHPFAEFLAVGARFAENHEQIVKEAYERGKQDGLKGKAESARKQSLSDTAPIPPKKKESTKSTRVPNEYAAVKEALGMNDKQFKLYQKMRADESRMVEA